MTCDLAYDLSTCDVDKKNKLSTVFKEQKNKRSQGLQKLSTISTGPTTTTTINIYNK